MAGRLHPVLKLVESCNLSCSYCYQEGRLGPGRFMAPGTLDRILEELARCTAGPMSLLWFGGEPTLAGRGRFERAVRRAEEVFEGRGLTHGLQTNGTLIDEAWAELLARHRFSVTVSLDGPGWLHDRRRPLRQGGGSHARVWEGIRALRAAGIEPRISAVLTPDSLPHPEALVEEFAQAGFPEVDFVPATRFNGRGFEVEVGVEAYARFMVRAFDRWLSLGAPGFRIRSLAELARKMSGQAPRYCKLEGSCSHYVTFGWNGDVFPCDEFSGVSDYRFGNVLESPLEEILSSPLARGRFGEWAGIPAACEGCRWRSLCRGGCPWERRLTGSLENPSILCEALKVIYDHVAGHIPGASERWQADPAGSPR